MSGVPQLVGKLLLLIFTCHRDSKLVQNPFCLASQISCRTLPAQDGGEEEAFLSASVLCDVAEPFEEFRGLYRLLLAQPSGQLVEPGVCDCCSELSLDQRVEGVGQLIKRWAVESLLSWGWGEVPLVLRLC